MITHKILCEICDHPLARAHLPGLSRPLIASMFSPIEAGHSDPFPDPNMTWEWMKCPMCKTRPFIITEEQASQAVEGKWPGPEQVKTAQGMYRIYSKEFPGVPPQINVQIHSDEELEKEWQARAKKAKPSEKSSPTKDTKEDTQPERTISPTISRKAKREARKK